MRQLVQFSIFLDGLDLEDAQQVAENMRRDAILNMLSRFDRNGLTAEDIEKHISVFVSTTTAIEFNIHK